MDDKPCFDLDSGIDGERLRLPVRPRPVEREAVIGYLIRVAAANGYDTPRRLWTALSSRARPNTSNVMRDWMGLSDEEVNRLFGMYPSYCGISNSYTGLASCDFNHNVMRWCPMCLRSSTHMHGIWGLKLCCACTQHAIMLCDRCPGCGQIQRLERANISRCECGARLQTSVAVPASNALLRVSKALEELVPSECSATGFPELSVAAWQRLVRYMGQFASNSLPARPGQIGGLHTLEVATALVSVTGSLLDSWPDNFHTLLAEIHRTENSTPSVRRTFGSLYGVLYFHLREPCFQFLRDAFEDYVHRNWWGIVCKRNRSFKSDTIIAHPQLTIRQAAIKANTAPAIVRHLIQSELILGTAAALPSGRKARSIHEDNIAHIVALTNECVTLEYAARRLALPKNRVRELIDGGIITPLISRPRNNAASWLISLRQLKKLSFASVVVESDVSCVTLKAILKFWKLKKGEFAALTLALLSGDVVPVAKQIQSSMIGNVTLDAKKIHERLITCRMESDGDMSVDLASKKLGLKQQVTYELVRNGILNSTDYGQQGKRISPKHLRDFQETFVSLAEISRQRGSSPKKILEVLASRPVCGPSVDGTRQYFFRRSDVDAEKFASLSHAQENDGRRITPAHSN